MYAGCLRAVVFSSSYSKSSLLVCSISIPTLCTWTANMGSHIAQAIALCILEFLTHAVVRAGPSIDQGM
jgi:hypothetical protein